MTNETPRILDLSSAQRSTSIVVDWSPAYELITVITALRQPDDDVATYAHGPAWFRGLRDRVPAELAADLVALAPSECKVLTFVTLFIHRSPQHADVDAVIDELAALPPADLYRAAVRGFLREVGRRGAARLVEEAVRGGAAERDRLIDWLGEGGEEPEGMRSVLEHDPAALQARLVRVLRGFRGLVAEHLEEVAPVLEREAALIAERIRGLDTAAAVEAATNGIVYSPEPGVRTILVIPQVAMRPWVLISDDEAMKIFGVAVAEESLAACRAQPRQRLLTICKALGEEQRLRILHRLAAGPASLTEIAELLGTAKSTAHHHAVALRSAGLITVELGAAREYRMREGIAGELAAELDAYLDSGRQRSHRPARPTKPSQEAVAAAPSATRRTP